MAARLTYLEAAYLAGIMDADGSVQIARWHTRPDGYTPQHNLRLTVANMSTELMRWLRDRLGGTVSITRPGRGRLNRRQLWHWYLGRRDAVVAVLEAIRPHVKGKAIEVWLALEFASQCPLQANRGRRVTSSQWALREGFALALQNLHTGNAGLPHRQEKALGGGYNGR